MKLCEQINEELMNEAVSYKLDDSGEANYYSGNTSMGRAEISQDASNGKVYSVYVGDDEIFSWSDYDSTTTLDKAKEMVEAYLKAHKVDLLKVLIDNKKIDELIDRIDKGRVSLKNHGSNIFQSVYLILADQVFDFPHDYGIPPYSAERAEKTVKSPEYKKRLWSKLSRLAKKSDGVLGSNRSFFTSMKGDKSLDNNTEKAIDKIIDKRLAKSDSKSGEGDFFDSWMAKMIDPASVELNKKFQSFVDNRKK